MNMETPILPDTRRGARTTGSRYYYTGKPCPDGHVACRYTSNGACSGCVGTAVEPLTEPTTIPKVCVRCQHVFVGERCMECRRRLGLKWAEANRAYLADRQRERIAGCRDRLRRLKEATPCSDCADRFPWYVTEFDHVEGRGDGDATVASLVGQGSWDRIEEEIAKCELVCSNCHKTRTHFRAVEDGQRHP